MAFLTFASAARGQSAAAHLAEGDRLYAAREAVKALAAYEAGVRADSTSVAALSRAARSATDLGEYEPDGAQQQRYFTRARLLAQLAVRADSASAEAHFQLSRAVGRVALAAGVKERVRLAVEVRTEAMRALARDPNHPGALHVLGVWNAEIMRLNGFERMMAKTFLGGKVLGEANWAEARRDLERAVQIEPNRLVHHLDLGRVYRDTGDTARAREEFELVGRAPVADYNDPNYKREAAAALRSLK